MSQIYQKGDLEEANAAYAIAKENFVQAEKALAVALYALSKAERFRSEKFKALVEKTAIQEKRI